jgi:hypothetical protein
LQKSKYLNFSLFSTELVVDFFCNPYVAIFLIENAILSKILDSQGLAKETK